MVHFYVRFYILAYGLINYYAIFPKWLNANFMAKLFIRIDNVFCPRLSLINNNEVAVLRKLIIKCKQSLFPGPHTC